MSNSKFSEQMEKLEQERDEHISRLTPESQNEFRLKEDELNTKTSQGNQERSEGVNQLFQ